jgi:hypothetical protein
LRGIPGRALDQKRALQYAEPGCLCGGVSQLELAARSAAFQDLREPLLM